jgi:hypothetical protein
MKPCALCERTPSNNTKCARKFTPVGTRFVLDFQFLHRDAWVPANPTAVVVSMIICMICSFTHSIHDDDDDDNGG